MSYCRFGWEGSDVYVFGSANGIECCGCKLDTQGTTCGTEEEMITHLALHRRTGHFVPEHAILRLWNEIEGAQKSERPEPVELTIASIQFTIATMLAKIDELKKTKADQ